MSLALAAKIESLERRLAALEAERAELKSRLHHLEQGMIREEDDPFPVHRMAMPKALKRLKEGHL